MARSNFILRLIIFWLQLMSKLYSANTTIVWNGNLVKGGSEKVTEFFNSLPATEHTLHSLDCQPVSGITREKKKKMKHVKPCREFLLLFAMITHLDY